jgi:hexosaminidase
MPSTSGRRAGRRFGSVAAAAITMAAMTTSAEQSAPTHHLVPAPASYSAMPSEHFELTVASRIVVGTADAELRGVAERFAAWLRRVTGFPLDVLDGAGEGGDIVLGLNGDGSLGAEGYTLRAGAEGVVIEAATAEGAFRGLTTLRQMLPPAVESATLQPGPWTVAGAAITDRPRFEYRGTMLDVARHFFAVEDVLRHIDLISLYKINVLHLHLTDDQGWRLTVPGWPRLTEVGAAGDIDGGAGGHYTADDLARIVAYAAEHFVEVVPEIDGPGHTTSALLSYPELGCDGVAPPPFHQHGISEVSLCAAADTTYAFLGDVFDALVAVPGRLIHAGGDEAIGTAHDDFVTYVPRVAQLVIDRERVPVLWHEAASADLPSGSVVQYWGMGQDEATELARRAVDQGARLILSPADRVYLDMKYDEASPYGLTWAGFVPVSAAYDWEPATLLDGVAEESILGVEAPLWSETVSDRAGIDFMVFPRLAGVAEIGWSPAHALGWDEYRPRLGAQGARWDVLGVNYFRSAEVPWSA